ncbi:hypothetical protein C8R34_11268 [Nitrosomonas sp. Nm84]|nr:hypothetical protein C8R34_11268 [Nitrosomonas sp. Nm84]
MEAEEKYYSFPEKLRFRQAKKFQPTNFPDPRKLVG